MSRKQKVLFRARDASLSVCCYLRQIRRSSLSVLAMGVIAVLLVQAAGASARKLIRNYTPPAWQADTVKWARDQDFDKIDDAIDTLSVVFFDIVVNYKDCVTDQDTTDLAILALPGRIQMKSKYLSSVAVENVSVANVEAITTLPKVAFIELQREFVPSLDVSVPNLCVTPGSSSPECAGDVEDLGFSGYGINIAIMDTGVDDHLHDTFAGVVTHGFASVQGYNAFTRTLENPIDEQGHGTHVASIALGRGGAIVPRGVARGAGLIDVKCIPGYWHELVDALETIYDMHSDGTWDVDVINGSFGEWGEWEDDGTDSFSQLVDLAESLGILFVASAGNDHGLEGCSTPCAATRSLCVSGSDDQGTSDRGDIHPGYPNHGPRVDDGDDDKLDELKPEVTAPGTDITAASRGSPNGAVRKTGTSQAAPHVAGIAALILEARPGINAASVKDLIISEADARGTPWNPEIDPEWSNEWGWGLVNAYSAVTAERVTDLSYPNYPPDPTWMSPDISVSPDPEEGEPTTVTVQIENRGPEPANNARVHFGVYVFSASPPAFQDIGTQIVDLPLGVTAVEMGWTPAHESHQCMIVEIGYGADTDYTNNTAQRNLRVARAGGGGGLSVAGAHVGKDLVPSPVSFWVHNTHSDALELIVFQPTIEVPTVPPWGVQITPPYVWLAGGDCPVEVEILLIPPDPVPPEFTQTVHVAATIGADTLGGVSVQYTTPPKAPTLTVSGLAFLTLLLLMAGMLVLRLASRRSLRAG